MQIRDVSVLPYCAVRYALGTHITHSGIAHTVISEITPMLTKLQDSDLETISISIAEYLDDCKEKGAWSIDDTDWKRFKEAIERERKRRDGLHRD